MTTDVSICNMALAAIGEKASLSSIDPPEGSPHAYLFFQFYAQTRDELLALKEWRFAIRRKALTLLAAAPPGGWAYAYSLPNDCLVARTVKESDAADFAAAGAIGEGEPFLVESNASTGSPILYTNCPDAVLSYTASGIDPGRFSPGFASALSWLLASRVAGSIIKGAAGRTAVRDAMQMYGTALASAAHTDGVQQKLSHEATDNFIPSFMRNR